MGRILSIGVVLALGVTQALTAMACEIPVIIPACGAEIAQQAVGVERIGEECLAIVMVKEKAGEGTVIRPIRRKGQPPGGNRHKVRERLTRGLTPLVNPPGRHGEAVEWIYVAQ